MDSETEIKYYVAHAGECTDYLDKKEAVMEYEHRLWAYHEGEHAREPELRKVVTNIQEYQYNPNTDEFE